MVHKWTDAYFYSHMMPITSLKQLDRSAKYSYQDYLTWEFSDVVELIKGRILRMIPAPTTKHQIITGRIFSDLENYLRRKQCQVFIAPFDVRLPRKSDHADEEIFTVVQPDICIICDEKKLDRRGCIGAPDMIIEVLSPGNFSRDAMTKYQLYEEFGVKEYWIVSPGEENMIVYLLEDGKYVLRGEYSEAGDQIPVTTLPGFALQWSEIFT